MRQKLAYTCFGIVSVIAFAYFVAILYYGNLVRETVNRIGPVVLEAPVNLDESTLGPLSGMGTLMELKIGHPAGWSTGDALWVSRIQLKVHPLSVLSDPVEINQVEFEKTVIHLETKPAASNLSDLLRHAEKTLGRNGPEARNTDGQLIRLVVRNFVVPQGTVVLSVGGENREVPLPEINLVNLGANEGGLTPPQLGFTILRSIATHAVTAVTRELEKDGSPAGAAALENMRRIGEAVRAFSGAEKKR